MLARDRRALAAVLASLALALPIAASADDADGLFQQGRALLAAGRLAEACAAFAASDALEPRIGTLLNLGECREQNQQVAAAWSAFLRAAALASRTANEHARADEARRRAGYLQPRLSYLTISVAEANLIEGLIITRDGAPVERAFWNQGVPVDGGTYVVEARSPGQPPWRTTVIVPPENGQVVTEVPRLKRLADLQDAVTPRPAPAALAPAEPAPSRRFTPLRFGALAAAGVGVASLGVAAWFGVAANQDAAAARALCRQEPCTDPDWPTLSERAKDGARLSNLALIGGGVAIAGAVTLWIVGRPGHGAMQLVPQAGADHVGVSLHMEL